MNPQMSHKRRRTLVAVLILAMLSLVGLDATGIVDTLGLLNDLMHTLEGANDALDNLPTTSISV